MLLFGGSDGLPTLSMDGDLVVGDNVDERTFWSLSSLTVASDALTFFNNNWTWWNNNRFGGMKCIWVDLRPI